MPDVIPGRWKPFVSVPRLSFLAVDCCSLRTTVLIIFQSRVPNHCDCPTLCGVLDWHVQRVEHNWRCPDVTIFVRVHLRNPMLHDAPLGEVICWFFFSSHIAIDCHHHASWVWTCLFSMHTFGVSVSLHLQHLLLPVGMNDDVNPKALHGACVRDRIT